MKKSAAGFTLIELLVIISIIGLVASVALANLNQARQRAQFAAAQQQESSIRGAIDDTLTGEWIFDEDTGSVATDTSGNGNDGEIIGIASFVEPGSNGGGYALYLPGPGSYVTGTGVASGNNEDTTITAWVNPSEITDARSIFNSGYDGCLNYSMALSSGGVITRTQSFLAPEPEECDGCTENALIRNNVWTFVATTFASNGDVKVYTNGTLAQTYAGVPTVAACGGDVTRWTIGALSDNNTGSSATENFSGLLDGVRVYRGNPFAQSDILRLYAQEAAKYKLADN